jgi:hypothetical protein
MSSLLTLNPIKHSTMFKAGTKIFFTVGNENKVLESLLFQIYSYISPQFKCVSVILKKWILHQNDLIGKNKTLLNKT